MIYGTFYQNNFPNIPFVDILIGWGQSIQQHTFILDTGFSGELKVTETMAKDLGLETIGVVPMGMINNQTQEFPAALALVDMEGAKERVTVVIGEGLPVLGIGTLTRFGYKACIDCKHRTVSLQKM
jgi:predicted aspartyl protease